MADLNVSTQALTEHAGQVATLMGDVRDAAAYGDQAFDVRAFGIIGSTWSWVLKAWCDDAKNLVDTTASAGTAMSTALTEMATAYDQHDAAGSAEFTKIQGALGGGS